MIDNYEILPTGVIKQVEINPFFLTKYNVNVIQKLILIIRMNLGFIDKPSCAFSYIRWMKRARKIPFIFLVFLINYRFN
jgi:hypothetical protein